MVQNSKIDNIFSSYGNITITNSESYKIKRFSLHALNGVILIENCQKIGHILSQKQVSIKNTKSVREIKIEIDRKNRNKQRIILDNTHVKNIKFTGKQGLVILKNGATVDHLVGGKKIKY